MYFSVLIVETAICVFIMLCMVSIFCLNLSGASMYFNLVHYLCIHSESADDLVGAEIRCFCWERFNCRFDEKRRLIVQYVGPFIITYEDSLTRKTTLTGITRPLLIHCLLDGALNGLTKMALTPNIMQWYFSEIPAGKTFCWIKFLKEFDGKIWIFLLNRVFKKCTSKYQFGRWQNKKTWFVINKRDSFFSSLKICEI